MEIGEAKVGRGRERTNIGVRACVATHFVCGGGREMIPKKRRRKEDGER